MITHYLRKLAQAIRYAEMDRYYYEEWPEIKKVETEGLIGREIYQNLRFYLSKLSNYISKDGIHEEIVNTILKEFPEIPTAWLAEGDIALFQHWDDIKELAFRTYAGEEDGWGKGGNLGQIKVNKLQGLLEDYKKLLGAIDDCGDTLFGLVKEIEAGQDNPQLLTKLLQNSLEYADNAYTSSTFLYWTGEKGKEVFETFSELKSVLHDYNRAYNIYLRNSREKLDSLYKSSKKAVSDAPLYHGTSLILARDILSENKLRASWPNSWQQGVSLTRNPKFSEKWGKDVVFKLNGRSLAHNNKVKPYDHYGQFKDRSVKNRSEAEELVTGDINNLNRVLDEVYFTQEFMEFAKDENAVHEAGSLVWGPLMGVMEHPKFSKEQRQQIPYDIVYDGRYFEIVSKSDNQE